MRIMIAAMICVLLGACASTGKIRHPRSVPSYDDPSKLGSG